MIGAVNAFATKTYTHLAHLDKVQSTFIASYQRRIDCSAAQSWSDGVRTHDTGDQRMRSIALRSVLISLRPIHLSKHILLFQGTRVTGVD